MIQTTKYPLLSPMRKVSHINEINLNVQNEIMLQAIILAEDCLAVCHMNPGWLSQQYPPY